VSIARTVLDMGSALAAVVFDFDGLLMDTESTMLASWEFEWQQWGRTLDRTTFFADHGGDVTDSHYAALARAVGPGFDRDLSHARRIAHRENLHAGLDLADGIVQWLEDARAVGLRLAVASSSPMAWVEGHLRRVGVRDAFDVIACGDEVDDHKPAPDVYLLALQRLGTADGCVAVEDTPHGVDAAHAAGLPCVAIPNPFVQPDRVARDSALLDVMSAALAQQD